MKVIIPMMAFAILLIGCVRTTYYQVEVTNPLMVKNTIFQSFERNTGSSVTVNNHRI
jgi:hypothetical protein